MYSTYFQILVKIFPIKLNNIKKKKFRGQWRRPPCGKKKIYYWKLFTFLLRSKSEFCHFARRSSSCSLNRRLESIDQYCIIIFYFLSLKPSTNHIGFKITIVSVVKWLYFLKKHLAGYQFIMLIFSYLGK